MGDATLKMEERKLVGGRNARRLRKRGYIPAVIYGRGMAPVTTQVKESELKDFLYRHGTNSIFTTEFAAEHSFSALVKEVRYNVFRNSILNVDFQKVSPGERVHAKVPVRVTGWERMEKAGSVIVHQLNEVTVDCLPQNIPHFIDVDVSGLTPGCSLTAAQLKLPRGVTLTEEPNEVILSMTSGKSGTQPDKVDEPVRPQGEEGNVKAKRV
ncbi:MAG: 50S ribosomal protein L25 [Clostridiales bacterium]|jgi:large subunit ribosomal protein L25|nr:50S ribosomal protein L25 [Eubacteriales bacterium]MDH7567526.1 50S ribosomal protein L25 [Clostridiales bacterium]